MPIAATTSFRNLSRTVKTKVAGGIGVPPAVPCHQPAASEDTGDNMTKQDTTERARKAARKLLLAGLITKSEAARLTGVTRQAVRKWIGDDEYDAARVAAVEKLWKRTFRG